MAATTAETIDAYITLSYSDPGGEGEGEGEGGGGGGEGECGRAQRHI